MMKFAALFLALVAFLAPAVDAACGTASCNIYAGECSAIAKEADGCWADTPLGKFCCADDESDCCTVNAGILAVIIIAIIIALAACGYVPAHSISLAGWPRAVPSR